MTAASSYCLTATSGNASEWFAHVSEEGSDEKVLADFKELRPEIEECGECPLYPDCFRLVKCEESVHCYPEEREGKIAGIRRQLKKLLDEYESKD